MKRILAFLFSAVLTVILPLSAYCDCTIETKAKSVILVEASTGEVLYSMNENESLPPASVTKIMTLLLVFEAIDGGKIALSDIVPVSERAASMGGSQVYLEAGEEMTAEELIKCVAVASANDAAAALAEYVSGTIEEFVSQMNIRAKELGLNATHFENVNGLDDTTTDHVTSAADIAVMSRELMKHEKIFDYTTIWMDTVRNGSFGLTNTNRLVRFYKGANGLKTGSTAKAGFCISATAKRDGMQLIAVVMGSPTRDERNATAVKLLDYGFSNFEVYSPEKCETGCLPVKGGKEESVKIVAEYPQIVLKKGESARIEIKTDLPEYLISPVNAGDTVGSISYILNGNEVLKVDLKAENSVEKTDFFDIFKKMFLSYTLF